MTETTCINTLTLYGLIAMAGLGFISAVVQVWKAGKDSKESPFK